MESLGSAFLRNGSSWRVGLDRAPEFLQLKQHSEDPLELAVEMHLVAGQSVEPVRIERLAKGLGADQVGRAGLTYALGHDQPVDGASAIKRRISLRIAAASLRWAMASADFRPCFQFARRLRSRPSGVRGPVLGPPCIRQRPFAMAAARQGLPLRVQAPCPA